MDKRIVQGKNIYLRDLKIEDINKGWLAWINDTNNNRYLSTKNPATKESLIQYLEDSKPPNVYMFAVCLNENDKYIGNCRLSSIDWIKREARYGRLLGATKNRNLGIGTELLFLIAYYAFYHLSLNKIGTRVIINNIASIKSNKKAGFVQERITKSSMIIDDKFVDLVAFGMTKELFDKTNWKDFVCTAS